MKACKKRIKFGVGIVALFMVGCTTMDQVVSPTFHEKQPDRIAVADVSGDIRGDAHKNQVADFFSMEMMRKGYEVIERERVRKVLNEQDFQRSDRATKQEAARIGEILNVPAVAMLDVNVDGEKVNLTGRIVDVDTGEVLWIGTSKGGSTRTLSTVAGAVTGGLLGSEIGSGRGRTVAIAAGGVLGGAAGDALSSRTAAVVQKLVKEMVKGLPAAR